MSFIHNYRNTYFFTATILEWKHLLKPDKYKNIITSTLQFLVINKRIKLFGFVIMPNHIHLIWYISEDQTTNSTQGSLLRFTSQKIRYDLMENHPQVLEKFKVHAKDRMYQLWERNPLSIPIYNEKVMQQKLEYIHQNPVHEKWNLASSPEEYYYSSAKYYATETDNFEMLTNCFTE